MERGLSSPSSFLPPIARLQSYSAPTILEAIRIAGRALGVYIKRQLNSRKDSIRVSSIVSKPSRKWINESIPDSGYASADSDDEDSNEDIALDPLEREFVLRWLTSFIARSSVWVSSATCDEEVEERDMLVEEAASLLSSSASSADADDAALTRNFKFPYYGYSINSGKTEITIELNDSNVSAVDHTSVGLQSWASSIVLAKMFCQEPYSFGLDISNLQPRRKYRVLELGAGTGLLSIAIAKIFHLCKSDGLKYDVDIVATDYHPDVLNNLRDNVVNNETQGSPSVTVCAYDWQHPSFLPPFDQPFDIIVAADVVYTADHSLWIKNCLERLLAPASDRNPEGGIFWMMMPVRQTGRHQENINTVFDRFPCNSEPLRFKNDMISDRYLRIAETKDISRLDGVGRADEGGYRLFKISWAER